MGQVKTVVPIFTRTRRILASVVTLCLFGMAFPSVRPVRGQHLKVADLGELQSRHCDYNKTFT